MSDTTASLGIEVKAVGVQQATSDLDKLNQSQKNVTQGTKDLTASQQQVGSGIATAAKANAGLATATTATAQSTSLFQRALSGIGGLFGPYGAGANAASSSLSGLAGAHGEVAKSMHLVQAVAVSAGSSIGGIGQFAMLARGGLTILAAGIAGTLIVSLERAADAVGQLSNRLKLFGGDVGGAKTLDDIKGAADKTGSSVVSLGENVRDLSEKLGALLTGWINPPGGDKAPLIITTLSDALVKAGIDSDTAQGFIKKYNQEIGNIDPATGQAIGLTQKLFDMIRKDAPQVAIQMAQAFGWVNFLGDDARSLQLFSNVLAQNPKTVDQLVFAIQRMIPELAKLKIEPTVTGSWIALKNSVENLWSAIGEAGGNKGASTTLDAITNSVKNMNAELQKGTGFWKAFWDQIKGGTPEEEQAKFDKFQAQIQSLFTPPQGWQTMWNQLGDLIIHALHLDGAKAAIQSFLDETDKMFQPWIQSVANSIMAVVQKAVAGIQAMLSAAAKSPLSGALTSPGMPSFDASNIDLGATASLSDTSNSDLMSFAQGGLTQVTGPSGTDKTLVSFMATNGEIVAVGNPSAANAASGGSSGAAVSAITQPITAAVQSSTSQIVGAITNASTNAPSAFPYGQPSSFSGTVNIKPYVGNPAGTMSDYASYSDIYGPDAYDPGPPTPDPTPFYNFASGFDGKVGGSGGTDSQRIGLNLTPGELLSVTPANKASNVGVTNVTQIFNLSQAPGKTYLSAAQIKRMMQQAVR